jgi:hypothetical protein
MILISTVTSISIVCNLKKSVWRNRMSLCVRWVSKTSTWESSTKRTLYHVRPSICPWLTRCSHPKKLTASTKRILPPMLLKVKLRKIKTKIIPLIKSKWGKIFRLVWTNFKIPISLGFSWLTRSSENFRLRLSRALRNRLKLWTRLLSLRCSQLWDPTFLNRVLKRLPEGTVSTCLPNKEIPTSPCSIPLTTSRVHTTGSFRILVSTKSSTRQTQKSKSILKVVILIK